MLMNLKQRKNKNFLQHAHEMFRHTFSYMEKKGYLTFITRDTTFLFPSRMINGHGGNTQRKNKN